VAIVVTNTIPGGGQDLYDKVTDKLGFGNQLPDGCQLHIAGPVDEGWRVITVWDSQEGFEQFRDNQLIPTIQEVGGDQAPTPQPSVSEVYRLITA
jgi:hypothetical protein